MSYHFHYFNNMFSYISILLSFYKVNPIKLIMLFSLFFFNIFIFIVGFEWLVVTTTTQCYVYNLSNLNTPTIFDIRAPPHFIHLCKKNFLTLDQISGIQVMSYEGRVVCSPRFQGTSLHLELEMNSINFFSYEKTKIHREFRLIVWSM